MRIGLLIDTLNNVNDVVVERIRHRLDKIVACYLSMKFAFLEKQTRKREK